MSVKHLIHAWDSNSSRIFIASRKSIADFVVVEVCVSVCVNNTKGSAIPSNTVFS